MAPKPQPPAFRPMKRLREINANTHIVSADVLCKEKHQLLCHTRSLSLLVNGCAAGNQRRLSTQNESSNESNVKMTRSRLA